MAAGHRLGNAVQPQGDLGDDAKRAFGAHEEPREIIACGGLFRPTAVLTIEPSAVTATSDKTLSFIVP